MSDVANILRFHLQGLQRVCRVIDGNPNYDGLMEHHLGDSHWAVFQTSSDIAKKRADAIALFEKKFRSGKAKAILPEFAGFACEGRTPNNVREFEFFERICEAYDIKILKQNYSDCDAILVSDLTNDEIAARDVISNEVESFYAGRDNITGSLVRQQILYSQAFFNFLLAFSRQGAVRPTALVQANDHSPVRVALSMVMKGLGIPRVYLQHAEVTQSFPELDFEYNVLRNARSRETYEAIGPITGEVFVVAREETAFARERLFMAREGSVPVVIYPSSRVLVDELIRVIGELQKNLDVSKVIIKQHPAAAKALDSILGESGVEFSKDIPNENHVAIVGNSAVVIELLHRGIPVYQNFDSDPTSADYYSFVASGLTYGLDHSDLSGRFWRKYPPTSGWIEMFAKWNPTAAEGYLEEQTRFADAMARIAKSSESPRSAGPMLSGVKSPQSKPAPYDLINRSDQSADEKHAQNSAPKKDQTSSPSPKGRSVKSRLKNFVRRQLAAHPVAGRRVVRGLSAAGSRLSRYAQVADTSISIDTGTNAILPSDSDRHLERDATRDKLRDRKRDKRRDTDRDRQRDAIRDTERDTQRDLALNPPLLALALSEARDPAAFFVKAQSLDGVSSLSMIRALETIISERDVSLSKFFEEYSRPDWKSAAGVYAFLRRSDWINSEMSKRDLNKALECFDSLDDKDPTKKAMINALFPALVSYGTEKNVSRFFDPGSPISWDKLTFPKRLTLVRKLADTPDRAPDALRLLEEMKENASELEALKLRNFEHLVGWSKEPWVHKEAEEKFLDVAPAHIVKEFRAYAIPAYELLRKQMRFMEVRSDPEQQSSLEKRIADAISMEKPFSCIRLSDREGYLFSREGRFTSQDVRNCELHWWGTELDDGLRDRIIEEARTAVSDADIVGIPSIYRFIRDVSEKSRSLDSTLQGRGLLDVLGGIRELSNDDAVFTEDKFNVGFVGNIERVSRLAAAAQRLVIVSSIADAHLPNQLTNHRDFQYISLPGHRKTHANSRYARTETILPLAYPEISSQVAEIAGPGTLVLVAGGLIGKILIGRAREAGSVVLDLGHVVDDWATTRSAPIR